MRAAEGEGEAGSLLSREPDAGLDQDLGRRQTPNQVLQSILILKHSYGQFTIVKLLCLHRVFLNLATHGQDTDAGYIMGDRPDL